MDNDKSIFERFTETVKGLADSAAEALNAEEPPKADQAAAAYMPLAAEGLVSDPLLVPPVSAQPARKKKRAGTKFAPKQAKKSAARTSANKSVRPRSRKATKKSMAAKAPRKAANRTTKQEDNQGDTKRAAMAARRAGRK